MREKSDRTLFVMTVPNQPEGLDRFAGRLCLDTAVSVTDNDFVRPYQQTIDTQQQAPFPGDLPAFERRHSTDPVPLSQLAINASKLSPLL